MRLIGRDADVAAVERALSAGAGGGAALSVIAGPGMGKSALLDAGAELAAARGWRVLRCGGVEAEAALAFSGVTDLLGPARDALGGWLPVPLQRALDVVMLRADPGDDMVEPHAVARAFAEALRALSARQPLVLVIDDVHWLDAQSARVLAFSIRRMPEQPIVIVAAFRDGQQGEHDIHAALMSLGERHSVLHLAPLTPGDIEQVLDVKRLSLPRASLRYVQDVAAGHPLYALELARHVAIAGRGSVPATLSALLERRLRELPADVLPFVVAAAQMAAPTRALVRSAIVADATAVDGALDAAADAQILVEDGGTLRFAHPLLAEAASAIATSAWRREVHRRLAAVVCDDEQRAVHLSLAHTEPDESIAAAIESGATRARARAAPEVAAELIAASLRLTPSDATESLRRRRIDGAYHNAASGRPEAGVALMVAALADEPDGEGLADLEWRAGMLHFLAGDVTSCIELLEDARERTADRAVRNHLSTRLSSMCCWASNFPRAAEVAGSIDVDQLAGNYRINAMAIICIAAFGVSRPSTIDPWQVIAEFEQLQPPPAPHEHPIARLIHVLTLSGGSQSVAEVVLGALTRAIDEADDLGIAWLAGAMAQVELCSGRADAATLAANDSLRAAKRANGAPALVYGLGAAATAAAYRGDADAARELASELIALGESQPILSCVGHGHSVLGFLALSRGEAAAAREEYLLAYTFLDREIPDQPAMPALRWYLVEALIDNGNLADAQLRIEQLDALPDHPLAAAMAATGRARIAALRGERDAADAAFDEALAAHDRLQWPFERAVTLYRKGCVLRDQRRRSLARDALSEALGAFSSLGAPLWESRARDALAGISGRAPSAPEALTRTEEEVAALAAEGLTNQQIAERLFVSPKTVATHLSHTYAKLNVRSRTELAVLIHRNG